MNNDQGQLPSQDALIAFRSLAALAGVIGGIVGATFYRTIMARGSSSLMDWAMAKSTTGFILVEAVCILVIAWSVRAYHREMRRAAPCEA